MRKQSSIIRSSDINLQLAPPWRAQAFSSSSSSSSSSSFFFALISRIYADDNFRKRALSGVLFCGSMLGDHAASAQLLASCSWPISSNTLA